jgi:hypothetical protein
MPERKVSMKRSSIKPNRFNPQAFHVLMKKLRRERLEWYDRVVAGIEDPKVRQPGESEHSHQGRLQWLARAQAGEFDPHDPNLGDIQWLFIHK